MTPLLTADVGRPCSRCRRPIDSLDFVRGGGAVRVPLRAGGYAVYRWCAHCLERRRQRALKFGLT